MGEGVNKYFSTSRVTPKKRTLADEVHKAKRESHLAMMKSRHDTDSAMTPKQRKVIKEMERASVHASDEWGTIVDKNGKVLLQKQGDGRQVLLTKDEATQLKDAVFTHNHPMQFVGGLLNVGAPLSSPDLKSIMDYDGTEVRAVSNGYTYSVQRPEGGWKGSSKDVTDAYEKAYNEAMRYYLEGNDKRFYTTDRGTSIGYFDMTSDGKTTRFYLDTMDDARAIALRQSAALNIGLKAAQKVGGFIYKRGKTKP